MFFFGISLWSICPNTPEKGLRFCQLHDQHATQFKDAATTSHANKDDPEVQFFKWKGVYEMGKFLR